jgi:hypothetical protein
MANYTVAAALVVAHTKNGVIHLYKGDVVPASITPDSLANLKELGFVQSADEEAAPEPTRAYPDEDPTESWTVAQLTAWAGDNGVEDVPAGPKPAVVEAVLTALAARKA